MDSPPNTADLERALREALPPDLQPQAAALVHALMARRLDPALRPTLRALAGQEVASGDALLSFGSGSQIGDVSIGDLVGGDQITISVAAPISQHSPQDQRNRRAMIQKVRAIWIDGLLKHSLAEVAPIKLGLTDHPDAVQLPLNTQYQEIHRPPHDLPAGTPIIKVFDKAGGSLLILGAPGAGKTTLLLELCRELLERAEQDETQPIPVVLNLSSWADQRETLERWLTVELNTKYDVPRPVATPWVTDDQIVPLLDGLDEVATVQRQACAQAINVYRQAHMVPCAVCSRSADYEALTMHLRLTGAVRIQPLTQAQTSAYLVRGGEQLGSLRTALTQNPALYLLASTPLMLSVMGLASSSGALLGGQDATTQGLLWDAYIRAMFSRRQTTNPYRLPATLCWLRWLAGTMISHSQTVFYLEWLQPSWLPTTAQRRMVIWGTMLAFTLLGTLSAGALGVFLGSLMAHYGIPTIPGTNMAVVGGALSAMIGGITGIRLGYAAEIRPFEQIRLSWAGFQLQPLVRFRLGTFFGLVVSTIIAVVVWISAGWWEALLSWAVVGILLTIMATLAMLLTDAISNQPVSLRTRPNEGMHRSARNALILAAIVAVVCGGLGVALGGLSAGLVFSSRGVPFGQLVGGSYGLIAPFLAMLAWGGGRTVLQHSLLRVLLWRNGSAPLTYVPFLDACADRALLHRVGGGYIFAHRLLMEHVAALSDDDIARLSAEIDTGQRASAAPRQHGGHDDHP